MTESIGIVVSERIAAARVSENKVCGSPRTYPEDESITDALLGVPAEDIIGRMAELVRGLGLTAAPDYVGLGMPGILRNGVAEDSPNLVQFKGVNVKALLTAALEPIFGRVPVAVFNDADVMAAGIAARHGHLKRLIRVWTLGNGIGYGRYPSKEGVWEAGHSIVMLDPKERFCGCGGMGHLEGVMGNRAMRLRFMDLEPEEIFAQAAAGEARCVEFVKLWHRALAAGTATSIHLDGPGKFYVTGHNARFVSLPLLREYLLEMVKLSPLQQYHVEVVPGGELVALAGAAVNARQATERESAARAHP
ncbi:MAG: ROK family protein [Bryobacteraceae bacterium]